MKKPGYFLLTTLATAALSGNAMAQNLVSNGDFEQLKDGTPIKWSIPVSPGLTETTYPTEKERGVAAQIRLINTGDKGAYFGQEITVEPNSRYRLTLQARMDEGKITFAVAGGKGEGALNVRRLGQVRSRLPMAPLFWEEDWLNDLVFDPGQWRPVTLEFDSGSLTKVAISFGAYFTAGTYAFDNVSVVKLK